MELGRPRPQPVPAGKLLNEFGTVEEIDSRNPDEVYMGEVNQLESRAQPALDRTPELDWYILRAIRFSAPGG